MKPSTRLSVSPSFSAVLVIRMSNRMSEGPAGLLTRPIETTSPPPYCAAFLSYVCLPVGPAKGRGTYHKQRPVYIPFLCSSMQRRGLSRLKTRRLEGFLKSALGGGRSSSSGC